LSPDGKQIASLDDRAIYVFPVTGDSPESAPVYTGGGGGIFAIAWFRDGKSLLACVNIEYKAGELWRIPVQGGEPEKWPLPFVPIGVDVHPDGRRIGLTAWNRVTEVWALENFLPKAAK